MREGGIMIKTNCEPRVDTEKAAGILKEIAKDLLIKDITPISRCKELMGTEKRMVFK